MRLVVLGSTGSIGRQTLEVAAWRGWRVVGLAAGKNAERLAEQIERHRPEVVYAHRQAREALAPRFAGLRWADDPAEVAAWPAEAAVAAIPGLAGLGPVRAAVESGKRVALANKEAMVAAGPLIWAAAEASGAALLPVDSEHSALFQALQGERIPEVAELILTASGGPFLREPEDLERVTPAMALRHPRWRMGPKVTVDSATLFNKGLEVLEAKEFFRVPLERIRVLVHPQAYIHGLVRFRDGSLKAQLGPTDMRLFIQYALTHPERAATPLVEAPIPERLELFPPDTERFPALDLAYRAGAKGPLAQVAANAADEVAVAAFLSGRIPFTRIPRLIERVIEEAPNGPLDWEGLYATDAWARRRSEELL